MTGLQAVGSLFRRAGALLGRVLRALFGSVDGYHPPGWLRFVGRTAARTVGWLRAHPKQVAGGLVLLAALSFAGWRGYKWYEAQPKPAELVMTIDAPGTTRIDENAKPDPLDLRFDHSAAPLALVGKKVEKGVSLEPAIQGSWEWVNDKLLRFTPKQDWPVGESFVVTVSKRGVLRDEVTLKSYNEKFESAPFSVELSQKEFYQDPQDQNLKKVVMTATFSHPVNPADLDRHLTMKLVTKKEGLESTQPLRINVTFDKLKAHAYIHSEGLQVPERSARAVVQVEAGLKSSRGGKGLASAVLGEVRVPGLYDLLQVTGASLTLVNNAEYEPEQVLVLETSTGVLETEIRQAVSAWLLPLRPLAEAGNKTEPYDWGQHELSKEVLEKATPVKLDQIANERDFATTHSFKFHADVGRMLYVQVKHGLRSFGGYVLDRDHGSLLKVPDYPQELKIMQSGGILALSGEKKVPLYARDVESVRVTLGRVLPGQLHHLVSQNSGNFQNPEFYNYRFGPENITETSTEVLTLPALGHGKAQYAAVDVEKRIAGKGEDRRGLFFVRVESWNPARKLPTGKQDSRLILVTDLGMLVKDNSDGTHDVFVQSLASGEPVKGVKIDVIGKNGLAVESETTDGDGHAQLPKLTDYGREKSPVLYLAYKGADLSFLPVDRQDRYLNLSRFPIDGVRDEDKPQGLSVFLFSDRGIYRPGDEIRVGMIVKSKDWKQKLAGVPLEATVTDARGVVVRREKLRLNEAGFEEIKHLTQEASPTGTWHVSIHIVKDGRADAQLGSTSVRVQEFLPDRLKITTRLSADTVDGWVSPEGLKGLVSLQNLFGTPATDRKVRAVLTLSPTLPSFAKFRDYHFSDPMYAKETLTDELAETTTNDQGEAELDLNLSRFAAATYRLKLLANGYEAEGGRGVASEVQVTVSPMKFLVGWKADGDLAYVNKGSPRKLTLIAVGPQGSRVAATGITAKVLERKYLSALTKQYNNTYKYVSVKRELVLSSQTLSLAEGGLSYPLPTDKAGDFILVLSNDKGQELNRTEWRVAGTANLTRALEKNAELQLVLKNPDADVGDELEVQIKAPYTGAGLITIERDKVLAYQWFQANTTASVQKIKIPEGIEGNGYVSVSFIRGLGSPDVFMSPLSYGVVPFTLSKERRTAKVTVQTADLMKPGDTMRIKYAIDRPGKIVVFAVDEGILQVAKYSTPEPLKYFFQKRALEVKTAQILDLLLPEFERVVHGASAAGGDGENAALRSMNPFKRRRDKPVAYWSGIIDADTKERELKYQIPDYFNGKLRVMAVAVAPDAVGVYSKGALVRGDFVLNPNVPTFVAPGDEFEVSVTVANNIIGAGKDAAVNLELKASQHVRVIGESKVALQITEMREVTTVFKLKATELLGSASLTFVASHGNKSGKFTTDLSVRPAAAYMTTTAVGHVLNGQTVVPTGRKMFEQFRVNRAGFSSLPLGLAHGLKQYLEKFPHGCTEQIVSQTMPALVLGTRPEFGITPEAAGQAIQKTLATLGARQSDKGGFGLWANASQVSDHASVYATHFLIEAKDRGAAVSPDVLKSALSYLHELASRETETLEGERLRAYAVYVLTRSGVVTSQYVSTVQKTLENAHAAEFPRDLAATYLAATYKLLKQERKANALISKQRLGELPDAMTNYEYFYDPLTRDAQLLFMLARHFPERLAKQDGDAILHIVKPIAENRYNTLSSAYTILALDAYATAATSTAEGAFAITEIAAGGQQKALTLPQGLFPVVNFSTEASKLMLASSGPLRGFYQVTQAGYDLTPPTAELKQKIEVLRELVGSNGKPLTETLLGEEIEVHLKLRALGKETLWNVAVVDLLPGGFEVVILPPTVDDEESEKKSSHDEGDGEGEGGNHESEGEGDSDHGSDEGDHGGGGESNLHPTPVGLPFVKAGSTWTPEYGDVREDRVVFYGAIDGEVKELVYRIKSTNVGSYVVPALQAEGMYDRSVLGRSVGGRIIVKK